jgi:hypothetical protein
MKKRVLLFLVGFFFLMGGIALISSFFLQKWREKRASSHPTPIQKIIQKNEGGLFLPTLFLEQLLELSSDRPPDFYVWSEKAALEKLLSFPPIASATVKKVWPQTVVVSYLLKKPVAFLYDYEKVAMDEKGNLFPLLPFLKYEKVPEIYLDLPPFGQSDSLSQKKGGSWKEPLVGKQKDLALHLLQLLSSEVIKGAFEVERIDLSKIFAQSYGKREIVILTKSQIKIEGQKHSFFAIFPQTLRLTPSNYTVQLGNYLVLQQKMMKDYQEQLKGMEEKRDRVIFRPRVIDLRLDRLAFVDER